MKKSIISLLVLLYFASSVQGQSYTNYARNSVFVEILGNSIGAYSLNYERIFRAEKLIKYSLRIGVGAYPFREPDYSPFNDLRFNFVVPAEANIFIGKGKHCPEIGLGITFRQEQITVRNGFGVLSMGNITNYTTYAKDRYPQIFLTARLGYRYQPKQKGVLFRIGANLIFPDDSQPYTLKYRLVLGACVGYAF